MTTSQILEGDLKLNPNTMTVLANLRQAKTEIDDLYAAIAAGTGVTQAALEALAVVQYDSISQVLEVAGVPLVSAHVAAMTDLLALSATTYNRQKIVVENPGGNTGNFYPTEFYGVDSVWKMINGWALLKTDSPDLNTIFPTSRTYTAADNGGKLQLQGSGTHSIAAAGAWKTYLASGPGVTPGWYTVLSVDSVNDFTVDHTSSGVSGTIVLGYSGTEIELYRIKVPPLGLYGGVTLDITSNDVGTGNHQVFVRYGASGVALASATQLSLVSDTGQFVMHHRASFRNMGSNVAQRSQMQTTNGSGWGANSVTTATQAPSAAIDNSAAVTDLIISVRCATAGEQLRLQDYEASWRY